jgi:muramoyltetrapeptide carboxypeptidase
MRLAGWFQDVDGIIFGRSPAPDPIDPEKMKYLEAVSLVLGDLKIPVLLDADIGHVPPQMTLINGALAEVKFDGVHARVSQTLC